MESASLRQAPPLPDVLRVGLIFGLFLLAAIAWAVTDDRMAGMDAGPGTEPGALGFWVTAWVVMMAAMMFPSIAPMVVMQVRLEDGRRRQGKRLWAAQPRGRFQLRLFPGFPGSLSARGNKGFGSARFLRAICLP